jgi:hypothetical protein
MAIIAESTGGSNYEPVEAGTYAARCYSMVYLGTLDEKFQGQEKTQKKVRLTFELPTELKVFKEEKGEQPCVLSKDFTLSMHEKSGLRKFLQNWRGKAFTEDEAKKFDITVLLGKPCMLSVIHKTSAANGKTYAEIAGVSTLMKGMAIAEQINPTFEFSVLDWDTEKFEMLPQFLKDKVMKSHEYMAMSGQAMQEKINAETLAANSDDLPF